MDVPEEMVMEILLRLPSKSVIRFKCVSKPWCSLLSSSGFMTKHLLPDGDDKDNLLMVKYRNKTTHEYVLSFLSGDTLAVVEHTLIPPPFPDASSELWNLEILGFCCLDGLVCICYDADSPLLALWNLATGDIKYLPPPDVPDRPGSEYFHNSQFGFGYDTNSQDYKVIRVTLDLTVGDCKVQVYTSNSDAWRGQHCHLSPGGAMILPFSQNGRVYANGIFSWRACLLPDEGWDWFCWFRMDDESFGLTMLPPNRQNGNESTLILNGRVSLVVYDFEPEVRCFHVWVLLEFGVEDSWTQLFTVGPFTGVLCPLRFWNNGLMIMENSDGDLVLCDPFTREIKSLGIHELPISISTPHTQIVSIPAKYIS